MDIDYLINNLRPRLHTEINYLYYIKKYTKISEIKLINKIINFGGEITNKHTPKYLINENKSYYNLSLQIIEPIHRNYKIERTSEWYFKSIIMSTLNILGYCKEVLRSCPKVIESDLINIKNNLNIVSDTKSAMKRN